MLSKEMLDTTRKLNQLFSIADGLCFQSYFKNLEAYQGSQVVVTVQPKGRHNAYGWMTLREVWEQTTVKMYEINLSAEYLNRPLQETLGTLIHEMVHLYNLTRGVKDYSRKGTYHNKAFYLSALDAGLNCEKVNDLHGYAFTTLADVTFAKFEQVCDLSLFADLIHRIDPMARPQDSETEGGEDGEGNEGGANPTPKKNKSNMVKYHCQDCEQSFKAKKGLILKCGLCGGDILIQE